MAKLFRPAISLLALLSAIVGVLYPLAVTGIAQALFPEAANGSLILRHGTLVGSALIGQQFSDPGHFWGRPSATSPYPYNGLASGGSNLGPSNPALVDAVETRVASLRAVDPTNRRPIPAELALASASGLDPHIGPAAAEYQVERVARARKLAPETVRALLAQETEGREWGLFGEPRVNVLKLNLALDAMSEGAAAPR